MADKKIKSILVMCKHVCYNVDRQNDRMCSYAAQRKAPEFLPPGLFYSIYSGWLKPQADYQLLFPVQPFANIVRDHTCQDRQHK